MIREFNQLVIALEKLNARLNKKIVTSQEIEEAGHNIIELHQDLELLMETIHKSSDVNVSITETLVFLNHHFVDIMSDVHDVQDLVGFALNRYRGLKKRSQNHD